MRLPSKCQGKRSPGARPKKGYLFQEELVRSPFWMMTACQLVNITTWDQGEPAFRWLRNNYTIRTLAKADPSELHEIMKPLGLWRRRSLSLTKFARSWTKNRPRTYNDILKMPGCGKYAADSWAIFVDGHTDVEPRDGKLTWYVEQMKEKGP